jgi:hypothetical protein
MKVRIAITTYNSSKYSYDKAYLRIISCSFVVVLNTNPLVKAMLSMCDIELSQKNSVSNESLRSNIKMRFKFGAF